MQFQFRKTTYSVLEPKTISIAVCACCYVGVFFPIQIFHTLLDLPCLSAAMTVSWASRGNSLLQFTVTADCWIALEINTQSIQFFHL